MFANGCEIEWSKLPRPDLPITVGIDGGYIHSCSPENKKKEWFEVIVGKSITDAGDTKCFGGVTSYDQKPKRRLFEVLKSQGMQMNQQVTFLSDGGENVRELQLYLPHFFSLSTNLDNLSTAIDAYTKRMGIEEAMQRGLVGFQQRATASRQCLEI